ncbi:MAG: tetratricopeptide repeat protein [Longimicrobiales bacterium]|nr:tetratricopeptide repeat protein [Longimicrobiales bacterium]
MKRLRSSSAHLAGWSPVLMLGVLLLVPGCSRIETADFEDPYIRQLEDEPVGWFAGLGAFRQYAAVDRAFELQAEGRIEAAADEVEGYLKLHPDDLRVRAYYLNLLTALDRPARVVEQADRLLEVEPEYVPALLARGRAWADLGELRAAVRDLTAAGRAPTIRPQDRADALAEAAGLSLLQAGRMEARGEWENAAEAYATALELPLDRADRVRALRGRARVAAARGRPADASRALAEATELAPGDVEIRSEAARAAVEAGDYDLAAEHLEAILASVGIPAAERIDVLDRLATAHERAGRPGDAAEQIEALIRVAPQDRAVALHVRAGRLHRSAGRPGSAATHLEAAAERSVAEDRARYLRRAAGLYREAGRYAEAVTALRGALAADPGPAVRAELRETLAEAGPMADVADTIPGDRGALDRSELTESRLAFAAAYEETGRHQNAMELYRLVAAVEEPGSTAWTTATRRLAELHARLGEHGQAGDRFMALHDARPGQPEAREGEWALRAADHYAAARAWSEAAAAYRTATDRGALPVAEGTRRAAVALVEAGDRAAARELIRSIPEEQRIHQDFRYLAVLAAEAGDTTAAVARYEQAAATAPTAADSAAMLRSAGYLELGRSDSAAVEALSRALEVQEDAAARLAVARLRLRLGQAEDALDVLQEAPVADWERDQHLARLDLLAEVHAEQQDTAAILDVLERAAELEPSAYRFNRLGFLYEFVDRYDDAATAFAAAYEVRRSAQQAAQVAYAYRRVGADSAAAAWFRRSIDRAREGPADTAVDLDALRREVAVLTDRLSAGAYISLRGEGGVVPVAGGVTQAGIGSQGGLELRYRPFLQRTSWGRDVDVFGRLFWSFGDGVRIDSDSFQGHLGARYRPPFLPGSALGLERWIALGPAGLDTWATRLQLSRLLGQPYPTVDEGASLYASLYGDAAYLFGGADGYVLYAQARPGAAVPLTGIATLLPHATVAGYHQRVDGAESSYVEGGPGLGVRLRFPVEDRYTKSYWSLQLMAQYRWGRVFGAPTSAEERYDELVLTFVLEL